MRLFFLRRQQFSKQASSLRFYNKKQYILNKSADPLGHGACRPVACPIALFPDPITSIRKGLPLPYPSLGTCRNVS